LLRSVRIGFVQTRRVFLGQDEDVAIGVDGHAFGIVGAVRIQKFQSAAGLHGLRKISHFVYNDNLDRFAFDVVIADIANVKARNRIFPRAGSQAQRLRILRFETIYSHGSGIFAVYARDKELTGLSRVVDVIKPARKLPRRCKPTRFC
jgi:hypothetical protein